MSQIVWISSPPMERLAEEALQNASEVAAAQKAAGGLAKIGYQEMRRRLEDGGGGFPPPERLTRAEVIEIGNGRALRVFRSPEPVGLYVMLHSGGWLSGGPDLQDARMAALSDATNTTVICPGYRLSPEAKHPDAVDDCEAAILWIIENGLTAFDTNNVIIAGESAGAHLAALVLLRLRDIHQNVDRVVAADLVYGFFDLSLSPSARLAGDDGIVLPTADSQYMIDQYLPPGIDPTMPDVSPVYADLRGLVPARFAVGGLDPLLDDTLTMSVRWRSAGNDAITEIYPNCIHGFDVMPMAMADLYRNNQEAWISHVLAG